MKEITLKAEMRTEQGSVASGRLRRTGFIPGVIKRISGETTLVKFDAHEYMMTMRSHHADQLLCSIMLDGQQLHALMREIQHDVMTGAASHLDFSEVNMKKPTRVVIALNLTGTPVGVKDSNGVLDHLAREIHVDCLPSDIVESFDVDVSALKVGDKLTVAQLNLGSKYHLATHADTVIAAVVAADEEIEVAAEPAEATPEVIAKGKAPEGDAAAPAAKK